MQAAENCKSHVTNTYPWPTALKKIRQQQTEALIQVSSLGYVWFFYCKFSLFVTQISGFTILKSGKDFCHCFVLWLGCDFNFLQWTVENSTESYSID